MSESIEKTPEITESVTRQVAQLARLALTPEEVTTFTAQLGKIIHYVDQLQQVDVNGVEPLTHPFEIATPLREDVVIAPLKGADGQPKVLESAPDVLTDGFKVPPIL